MEVQRNEQQRKYIDGLNKTTRKDNGAIELLKTQEVLANLVKYYEDYNNARIRGDAVAQAQAKDSADKASKDIEDINKKVNGLNIEEGARQRIINLINQAHAAQTKQNTLVQTERANALYEKQSAILEKLDKTRNARLKAQDGTDEAVQLDKNIALLERLRDAMDARIGRIDAVIQKQSKLNKLSAEEEKYNSKYSERSFSGVDEVEKTRRAYEA